MSRPVTAAVNYEADLGLAVYSNIDKAKDNIIFWKQKTHNRAKASFRPLTNCVANSLDKLKCFLYIVKAF